MVKKPKVMLADNFPLPIQVVTESIAIMGRKGSGKTYTGGRLFEQMYGAGAQCVVLDPVGNFWGLRLSASGKRRGLAIPVFGGDHGDIPITPEGGKLMARVVVERKISCVIDLMNFRKNQRKKFVTDFAEELFHLKKRNRSPIHMFLEEARKFIPQKPFGPDEMRMIGAFEDIVRLGRNYGLGSSMIDQRPQSVNKEVLSQVEIFIVHQLTEKHGRKEIEDWVRTRDVAGADQLKEIAKLRAGEAFLWSPGLLRKFARVKVGRKSTYDASATPELGDDEDLVEAKPLSAGDLEQLKGDMAAVVEQAEATDPKKLRVKIRRQKAEIKKLRAEFEARPVEAESVEVVKLVEVPVIDGGQVAAIESAVTQLCDALRPVGDEMAELYRTVGEIKVAACKAAQTRQTVPKRMKSRPKETRGSKPARVKTTTSEVLVPNDLTGPEQRILNAIAWMESIGVNQPEVTAVAFLAGYRVGGGAFNNPKGRLRSKGLISYAAGKRVFLTDEGRALAQTPDTPLDTAALHAAVLGRLPGPEQRILQPLLEAYPENLSNDDLAAQAGYNANGGGYANPRGRLRTLGLIEYPESGMVVACDILFLDT